MDPSCRREQSGEIIIKEYSRREPTSAAQAMLAMMRGGLRMGLALVPLLKKVSFAHGNDIFTIGSLGADLPAQVQ